MLEHTQQFGNKTLSSTSNEESNIATNPLISSYISASAGSGKTTLLLKRILRLALINDNLASILCLVFTNAAANEIKNRLWAKASKWMICSEEDLKIELKELQKQKLSKDQVNKARSLMARLLQRENTIKIQTIHSFCAALLKVAVKDNQDELMHKNNFESFNAFSSYKILTSREKLNLLEKSFDNVMSDDAINQIYLKHLITIYDISFFKEMIFQVLSMPIWESNLSDYDIYLKCEEAMSSTHLIHKVHRQQNKKKDSLQDASIMQNAMASTIIEYYNQYDSVYYNNLCQIISIEKDVATIEAWLQDITNVQKFYSYSYIFLRQDLSPRAKIKVSFSDAKQQKTKKTKKSVQNSDSDKNFDKNKENSEKHANNEKHKIIRLHADTLAQLHDKVKQEQSKQILYDFALIANAMKHDFIIRKSKNAFLEYDELLEQALYAMELNASILYDIDYRINHVLVDEAQDFSHTQWRIVHAITSEFYAGDGAKSDINRTLFVVGDYKQSIFSFQGAIPEEFLLNKKFFKNAFTNANKKWHEVELHTCYRCSKDILVLVDKIFNQVDIFGSAALNNDDIRFEIKHKAAQKDSIISLNSDFSQEINLQPINLWLFEPQTYIKNKDWFIPTKNNPINKMSKSMELAEFISSKTLALIEDIKNQIHINKQNKINFISQQNHQKNNLLDDLEQNQIRNQHSILILFRKRSDFLKNLIDVFKHKEVQIEWERDNNHLLFADLIAIAEFVLNPVNDLNLACLLKSYFIGINDDELFYLCYGREVSLWHNINLKRSHKSVNYEDDYCDHNDNHNHQNKKETWIENVYQQLCKILLLPNFSAKVFYTHLFMNLYRDFTNIDWINNTFLEAFMIKLNEYHDSRIYGRTLQGFILWAHEREEEFYTYAEQKTHIHQKNTEQIFEKSKIDIINATRYNNTKSQVIQPSIKISTVHGAKGLEADIVILADASYTENLPYESILSTKTWFVLNENSDRACNYIKNLKVQREKDRNAEDMRLMYVAMTRAKKAIYLVKDIKQKGGWAEIIANHYEC